MLNIREIKKIDKGFGTFLTVESTAVEILCIASVHSAIYLQLQIKKDRSIRCYVHVYSSTETRLCC